jgi:glycosyltransferase involved in cell wall biosynthesis
LRLARRHRIPVVGTNHFLPANWSNNLYIPRSVQGVVHKAMWKDMLQVFNQLDAATTPTETAVAILRKQDIHIPVKAISCGVDQEEFCLMPDIDRNAVRRHYRLAIDVPVLLYVGRVDREKGLDSLLQAAALADANDFQIAIAGKGMHRDTLIESVQDLGLSQRVVFPGYVPSDDLPVLLNSIDAFVMPSAAELQSIATLEAMSCARPILAANARALPELVEHGVNGYLFTPHSADHLYETIRLFLNSRARWAQMGEASLQRARPHQLDRTIARYVEWYESICRRTITQNAHLRGQSFPASGA